MSECDLHTVRLHPRFGVEQGKRPDGTVKVRSVDNYSWHAGHRRCKRRRKEASVNGHCLLTEKITHDHVDDIVAGMASLQRQSGVLPWLWKLDIDSAYRRVPLASCDQWASWISFRFMEQVFVAMQLACPFGATSSVQAWQRIAAAVTFLGRSILGVVVFCYVEDYIGVDRCCACLLVGCSMHGVILVLRPECAEHAMQCMARLVRVILGKSAVAARKLEFGPTLVALGIRITPCASGYRCELDKEKAAKCIATIMEALATGELYPGVARKLAGRLSWASQFVFRRLGRAMLRPIFGRGHSSECLIDGALRQALMWWLMILREGIAEVRPWQPPRDPPLYLHVDARGVPPRQEHA